MLREDLSGRFDYLFEPVEGDESADGGDDQSPEAPAQPEDDNRWSNRIVLTGVVLATLAVAAAMAIVLLQPARPARQPVIPSDSTPLSTVMSTQMPMPTTTAPPVPVAPTTVSPSTVRTSVATPTVEPPRPPAPPPATIASEPPGPMPPPPTTRAPISVSPETRAPFPNQTPPRNNDQRGGLLGGLL